MEKPVNQVELRATKPSKQDFAKIPRNPIYVILDDLIYPHNIGNILRLSEALLVTKIFIWHPTLAKIFCVTVRV